MFKIIRKIILVLTEKERSHAVLLTCLMALQAMIEVSGIASIAPFLAVLGNPDVVHTSPKIAWLYNTLGMTSPQTFMIAAGILAFIILTGAAALRGVTQYARYRFVNMRRHTLNLRLLEKYIRQPYAFFLQNNTSQMSKTILSEVDQYIMNALMPLLQVFSYGFVAIGIIALLLAVNLKLALSVAGVLGIFYGLIYWRLSAWTGALGWERKAANSIRFQITAEILGGIKELKVLGREQVYLDTFHWPSLRFARCQTAYQTLADVPRYLIETVGICTMFLIVMFLMHDNGDMGHMLPVLGLYGFAGYRLLPAAQNIYNAFTTIRFMAPATENIFDDLNRPDEASMIIAAPDSQKRAALEKGIGIENLSFTYPGVSRPVLNNLNFSFPALSSTGIVGATGAGKSTLVDLILGILTPSSGEISADGVTLDASNMRSWQANIGYVPQQIFLADDTVARNIAFGVAKNKIDMEAVTAAAEMAQLHGFIETNLPQKYDTLVGERGVRLSGGQRQRLGIARALYHNPELLIFDEATSALDTETEEDVMRAIDNLAGRKTILMIAHRYNTLRQCQRIVILENGEAKIVDAPVFFSSHE